MYQGKLLFCQIKPMSFAIVTDSTCDLPQEYVDKYNIHVAPLYINWGTESLKDGVDITSEQFYQRLATDPDHPKTSQPSVADFAEIYKNIRETGESAEILTIVVSKEVSGTYNSAIQAKDLVDIPVTVVDSRIASIAMGFLVLTAAEARAEGKSLAEVVKILETAIPKVQIYFTVATLEFLQRGGRIGKASQLIGETLKIKPIMYADDGVVGAKTKVRTAKRALQKVVDLVKEDVEGRTVKRLAIIHANAPDDVEALQGLLADVYDDILVITVCTAVGTHAGPGLYGVTYELE